MGGVVFAEHAPRNIMNASRDKSELGTANRVSRVSRDIACLEKTSGSKSVN
jgi:hypothetical protein